MRLSKLFTKTSKDVSKEEVSHNAQLLIRAGFIQREMAGVYSFLPLGLRVLRKIEKIIREEMEAAGGQEVLLPAFQAKENWQTTNRWQDLDVLYKIKSRFGQEIALGPTHEEVIVPLAKRFTHSYKDLPIYLYQIQTKFRDEARAKSGLLRGREFIMKDLYSFHAEEKDLDCYYEKMKKVYHKIFSRCGLKSILTYASGGTFCQYSHEFQVISSYGEDEIYFCQKCGQAINREIGKAVKNKCLNCGNKKLEIKKAIEVGNIFKLKDKYSSPFDLNFIDKDGKEKMVIMGCYGIGLPRLMGAIVEVHYDEKGIIWPQSIAPFKVQLIELKTQNSKLKNVANRLYNDLQKANIEVFYDDRKISAGEKFADADLIGCPYRLVISDKTLAKNRVEVKKREQNNSKLVAIKEIVKILK